MGPIKQFVDRSSKFVQLKTHMLLKNISKLLSCIVVIIESTIIDVDYSNVKLKDVLKIDLQTLIYNLNLI